MAGLRGTDAAYHEVGTVQLRIERTEDVRARAQHLAIAGRPADLTLIRAAGDAATVTAAWASFVPFLAHPVMADTARAGMDVLEQTSQPQPRVA